MGVTRCEQIVAALREGGLAADTPAAAISAAHTPRQRHAVATLATLAATVAVEKLASPAILVIGDVVRAAACGAWCQPTAAASWQGAGFVETASSRRR
jgi:uroporphyrin-III C-methyltransferase